MFALNVYGSVYRFMHFRTMGWGGLFFEVPTFLQPMMWTPKACFFKDLANLSAVELWPPALCIRVSISPAAQSSLVLCTETETRLWIHTHAQRVLIYLLHAGP